MTTVKDDTLALALVTACIAVAWSLAAALAAVGLLLTGGLTP